MTPITKNIRVVDESGKEYEETYPKRAKGLVKSGRERFADENCICLVRPPNNDLEAKHTQYKTNPDLGRGFGKWRTMLTKGYTQERERMQFLFLWMARFRFLLKMRMALRMKPQPKTCVSCVFPNSTPFQNLYPPVQGSRALALITYAWKVKTYGNKNAVRRVYIHKSYAYTEADRSEI